MRAILYAANTAAQNVAVDGVISFGNVVRRCGNSLNISNGAMVTAGLGYTNINVNVSLTTATAGNTTITLLKDGVPITGASATLSTTANDNYSVTIPVVIRDTRCCGSIITAISSTAATITNAAIVAEKY